MIMLIKLPIARAAQRIAEKYKHPGSEWVLAFSGGKDSSALLLSTIAALRSSECTNRTVTVVFCNTGVENPLLVEFVNLVFRRIRYLRETEELPIRYAIVRPELRNMFWVKVIGRGCPPPTNRFRWCTDKLRVNPIRDFVRTWGLTEALTLTGIREEESQQRKRTIERYATQDEWGFRYYDANQRQYFCPILDYTVAEVWELLRHRTLGYLNWSRHLERLYGYGNAGDNNSTEIRTGCWICTVIRRDRSAEQLVCLGHDMFRHLKEYRDWLSVFRDDSNYRCSRRRNGMSGPGPLTLKGRKIILKRLIALQGKVEIELITQMEVNEIKRLWALDEADPRYRRIAE